MRKRILSLSLLFTFILVSVWPIAALAAGPKAGDYVDPVEYYDLQRFAGMQLTAKNDIRKAILEKKYLPVELVLEPLALDYAAIRMATGNSNPSSGQDTYPFDGGKLNLKDGEENSYIITHSSGSSGHENPGVLGEYVWEWKASIDLRFNNINYYIETSDWGGPRFKLAYETTGTASSRGSKNHLDGADSALGDIIYTGDFTFNDSVDDGINWYVDDNGILRIYLPLLGNQNERWEYPNRGEADVSNKQDVHNQANVSFKIVSVKLGEANAAAGAVTGEVNTDADKEKGESSVPIPEAIAISILGIGAAIAGAGSSNGDKSGKKSRLKMCLRKDFGDAIRYDTQPVIVYARIVEITSEGEEIERLDLTASIQIFPGENLSVKDCVMAGNYMGALVSAQSVPGSQNPNQGVISIKFTNESVSFQNNVSFRLIGDPYIEYYSQDGSNQLPILGASGRTFTMDCEAKDFTSEPELTIKGSYPEFTVKLETLGESKYRIFVTDRAEKPQNLEKLKTGIDVEVTAQAGEENYKSSFTVIQCFEGLAADYWGRPKEIRAYADENDEMVKTVIGFSLGLWNETDGALDINAPQGLEISLEDEKELYKLIGIEYEQDKDSSLEHVSNFIFTAQKPYPATAPAQLTLTAVSGDYTYQSVIELIPDIQEYSQNYEKEYKACKKIIEVYMAPRFRDKKLSELENARKKLGLEDLKLFRKNCWSIAEISIRQEGQEYLADAAWYDEAIATADVIVYIGDIAFDLALSPIGGPITGFLVGQVKSSLLELFSLYIEGTNQSISELTWDFVMKRLEQTAGSGDGLIEMPKPNEPKKLAIWLSCYVIYRIAYHWQFDKDDSNNSIGITESIKRGLLDFMGKGAGILLEDFINTAAKGRWPEKISIAEADQELTNKMVEGTAKTFLDAGDKLAAQADNIVMDTTAYVTNMLTEYLGILKRGF